MTKAEVTIRPARDGDGDELVEVWDDARLYYAAIAPDLFQEPHPDAPVDADGFVASFKESDADPHRFARVAELDAHVVGYVVARVDEPLPNAEEQLQSDLGRIRGYIEALGVHRSAWRLGVGRTLTGEAEQWARRLGAEVMKTDTSLASPVSMPFYKAMGYEQQAVVLRKPL